MFIGRTQELQSLQNLINRDLPSIGVVYGRRRIGKSELIKKSFEGKPSLIFEGLENRSKREQIDSFVFQLSYQTGRDLPPKKVQSWQEAFMLLYEELKLRPALLLFDEFQWMANYRNEIVSELKMVWELYLSKIKGTTLILCGSIASFMIMNVVKSSALYGRTDLILHLKGFLLPEAKEFLNQKGDLEILEAYMLLERSTEISRPHQDGSFYTPWHQRIRIYRDRIFCRRIPTYFYKSLWEEFGF